MVKITDRYRIEVDDNPPRYSLMDGEKLMSYHSTLDSALRWFTNTVTAKELNGVTCDLNKALDIIIERQNKLIEEIRNG